MMMKGEHKVRRMPVVKKVKTRGRAILRWKDACKSRYDKCGAERGQYNKQGASRRKNINSHTGDPRRRGKPGPKNLKKT